MKEVQAQAPVDTINDFVGECQYELLDICGLSWIYFGVIGFVVVGLFLVAKKIRKK